MVQNDSPWKLITMLVFRGQVKAEPFNIKTPERSKHSRMESQRQQFLSKAHTRTYGNLSQGDC